MSPRRDTTSMPIGLDRLVRLRWMEQTAFLALAGNGTAVIKSTLREDLKTSFRSTNTEIRGSIDKTVTVLTRVWGSPPVDLKPLRIRGLDLLKSLSHSDHLAVHWGMVTSVYPFWSAVAIQVGRLLRLQGSAAAAHIQRRVREQYGERETVSRRTRYVLRSYLDWGVLREAGKKGIYDAGPPLAVDDPRLIAWLVEASLYARGNGSVTLKGLLESPSLFPFRLKSIPAGTLVAACPEIEVVRHGMDDDLVTLVRQPIKRGPSRE